MNIPYQRKILIIKFISKNDNLFSETEVTIVLIITIPTDHVEVPLTLRSELEISNPLASVKHNENE